MKGCQCNDSPSLHRMISRTKMLDGKCMLENVRWKKHARNVEINRQYYSATVQRDLKLEDCWEEIHQENFLYFYRNLETLIIISVLWISVMAVRVLMCLTQQRIQIKRLSKLHARAP